MSDLGQKIHKLSPEYSIIMDNMAILKHFYIKVLSKRLRSPPEELPLAKDRTIFEHQQGQTTMDIKFIISQ